LADKSADKGVNQDFASTAIVGEIMRETEGFFAEHVYEFLLFLDTLLVKDSAKLIECIRSISAERRDILRGILPDIDGTGRDGRLRCSARISLRGHGEGIKRDLWGL